MEREVVEALSKILRLVDEFRNQAKSNGLFMSVQGHQIYFPLQKLNEFQLLK